MPQSGTPRSLVRRAVPLLTIGLVLVVAASAAFAKPNFGGPVLAGTPYRGVRSTIAHGTLGWPSPLPGGEVANMRVDTESGLTEADGLIQVGFAHTNQAAVDDCGQMTSVHNYFEIRESQSAQGQGYHCGWVSNLDPGGYTGSGASQRYTVQRSGASWVSQGGTTFFPWSAYVDGNPVGWQDLKWGTGELAVAGGEYNNAWTDTVNMAVAGTVSGNIYGCYSTGTTPPLCSSSVSAWSTTGQICCSSGWTAVLAPTIFMISDSSLASHWHPGVFPQPFQVSHP